MGLGKRKLIKEVVVGNDTAPKKHRLDQVQTLTPKGGKVSLDNTSFPLLRTSDENIGKRVSMPAS